MILKSIENKIINFLENRELERIKKIPRFKKGNTKVLGKPLRFPDSASFLFIFDEMFRKEIYKFESQNKSPYIIDGGANIGLSIIYFKKLYPNAQIVAFEPDNEIFKDLEFNIESFGFDNIMLINKALWNEETTLRFYSEGADGGRIASNADFTKRLIEIQTCKLNSYLQREVDLLKIDIEGAEYTVLEDSKELLPNVKRLFVEYHSFLSHPQNLGQLLNILHNAGFRYQIQHNGVFSQNPFIQISNYIEMDLQLNIFAYRT
jgi:FkbM family methyltransferase